MNKEIDFHDFINEEINFILNKVFSNIEINEKINQERCDADIKFNTLNLDEIISQANNNNNIYSSFDNIILSNSFNNFNNDINQDKKEPVKINDIEELLLNEEQITEIIYTYDKRYKDCFNEANIIKLIDYSTHMPYISDDETITHKYPFYACELLKCDAPYIYENFFNNKRVISYFFEFLNDSKNSNNCVLSGYFTKIFLSLLDKKSDEIINYIFKEENSYIIEQIIELCKHSSYCECIKNLLTLQSDKYDDKKLFIIKRLNQKIFREKDYTDKICFEIYSSLLEEGNIVFLNFFLKNFEKIYLNYKHKSFNLELFFYYIHLVRVIKECFTREKENNLDYSNQINRKELNTYVINNKKIYLDFEISLIDSLTNILFIQNSVEDKTENKSYRRIIVSYLDILDYIVFTCSMKDKENNNEIIKEKEEEYNYYINKIHDIFTNNILLKITSIIFKYPLFNMLQVSYINLFDSLSKINSPLLNNDIIINKLIENLINEYSGKDILLSFLVKTLSIIYLSLQKQNILINKKLKYAYDCIVKNIMNIFESKLLFNEVKNEKKNDINENIISNKESIENKKEQNNIFNNDMVKNENNENNNVYNFKDIVNKGIYDYINIIRFCSSSKNLNSADNISEEIDLDDINDDDEENDNIGNNKNFMLTSFDELDEDENKSDNESIGEIFKKTAETIKSIKLRNKLNNNNDDVKINEKEKKEEMIEEIKENDIINEKIDEVEKNEKNIINGIINKNNDKYENFFEKEINNKKKGNKIESSNDKKNSINFINQLNDNPETSSKVNVKSIFDYTGSKDKKNRYLNSKEINAIPKIRMKLDIQEHNKYFYRDSHKLIRVGSNLNDKINNFRSNNIIKTKENKDTSLFNSLRKSSDSGTNSKFCLTLLNNIKKNDNK